MTDTKEDVVAEAATEAKEVEQKGFTLLVDEGGVIKLTPINLANDFELVGYLKYGSEKADEILKSMAKSPEVRTLAAVSQLTGVLGTIFQTAQAQVDGEQPAKA